MPPMAGKSFADVSGRASRCRQRRDEGLNILAVHDAVMIHIRTRHHPLRPPTPEQNAGQNVGINRVDRAIAVDIAEALVRCIYPSIRKYLSGVVIDSAG